MSVRTIHRLSPLLLVAVGIAGCASRVQEVGLEATFEAGEVGHVTVEVGHATADAQTIAALGPTLSLVFVPEGTPTLPVREAPVVDAAVVDELDRYTMDVPSTGRRERVHGITWVEVLTPAGLGWINAEHTTEFVPSEDFCDARGVSDYALHELANALHEGNADRFASLVSPTHGLRVRYVRTDEPSRFTVDAAAHALTDDQPLEWGVDPASGEMVRGSFGDRVSGELSVAISNGEITCNRLTTGVAPDMSDVPDSEVNLNFVSVHLPAEDALGMGWVTWTVGLAIEDGRATIATLNRYAWEG